MTITARANRPLTADHLFKDVPETLLEKLTGQSAGHLSLARDGRLFEQGDPGGSMYAVREGRMEISVISEVGKRVVFNQIGPGECFGEISMLDQGPRTASAVAMEPSKLLMIKRADFMEAVNACPALAINLLEIMSERIRWTSRAVEEYSTYSLELRLARRLITLHANFAGEDGAIDISQTDLADFAGATREATNKILMDWKSAGLVRMERRKIAIVSQPELARIAHLDEGH